MNFSLEKLVKNLSDFKFLTQEFGSENLELLNKRMLIHMRTWDSFKRFSKYELPDKEYFYRSLKAEAAGGNAEKLNAHMSDEEYLRCIKIWNEFNMKNMGNYHDDYLKKDVLLLASVFEKLIDTFLRFYKIGLCHYFSSPGLSWDAMLKMTGVKFENNSDIDM